MGLLLLPGNADDGGERDVCRSVEPLGISRRRWPNGKDGVFRVAAVNEDLEKRLESPCVAGERSEDDDGVEPPNGIRWLNPTVLSMVVNLDDRRDDTLGSPPAVNGNGGKENGEKRSPKGSSRWLLDGGLEVAGDDDFDDMPQS